MEGALFVSEKKRKKFLLKNFTFVGEKLEKLNYLCKNNNKKESQRKKIITLSIKRDLSCYLC